MEVAFSLAVEADEISPRRSWLRRGALIGCWKWRKRPASSDGTHVPRRATNPVHQMLARLEPICGSEAFRIGVRLVEVNHLGDFFISQSLDETVHQDRAGLRDVVRIGSDEEGTQSTVEAHHSLLWQLVSRLEVVSRLLSA